MGLNINVYQNVNTVDTEDYDFEAYVLEGFEVNIKNLEKGAKYCGKRVLSNDSYPYSHHNNFRRSLGVLCGFDTEAVWKDPDKFRDKIPFFRFINFADNEGCMDWETSKILYQDFLKYKDEAEKGFLHVYFDTYKEWLEIFELAQIPNSVVEYC